MNTIQGPTDMPSSTYCVYLKVNSRHKAVQASNSDIVTEDQTSEVTISSHE